MNKVEKILWEKKKKTLPTNLRGRTPEMIRKNFVKSFREYCKREKFGCFELKITGLEKEIFCCKNLRAAKFYAIKKMWEREKFNHIFGYKYTTAKLVHSATQIIIAEYIIVNGERYERKS